MDEPPVIRTTVLFVTRNDVESLRRSLTSVEAAQDRASIETIVVDNGSTDGSAELDAEFPAASFLRLPKNFGHTRALNIGIRTAKGDYVLIAEPGTEFPPDAIGRLTARLETDADAAAVCPRVARAYILPTPEQLFGAWKGGEPLPETEVAVAEERPSAAYPKGVPILVRRRFLAGMRNLDERFGDVGWDLDLCRQIRNAGKKIVVMPDVDLKVGEVPRDASRNASLDQLNAVAVYAGKYYGFGAALRIRLAAALTALLRFDLAGVSGIVSGRKIDGEQPGA